MKQRTSNYIKVVLPKAKTTKFFFFDDRIYQETLKAWRDAQLACMKDETAVVSLYQPARYPGEWDSSFIIGHRNRDSIEADIVELSAIPTPARMRLVTECINEREALDERYRRVLRLAA